VSIDSYIAQALVPTDQPALTRELSTLSADSYSAPNPAPTEPLEAETCAPSTVSIELYVAEAPVSTEPLEAEICAPEHTARQTVSAVASKDLGGKGAHSKTGAGLTPVTLFRAPRRGLHSRGLNGQMSVGRKEVTRSTKRRLVGAASFFVSILAASSLVAGVTFGLFSATPKTSTANTFSTGTVSLNQSETISCTVANLSPGDGSYTTGSAYNNEGGADGQCTLAVSYTGNVPAYLGLDIQVSGTVGSPVQTYGGSTLTGALGLFDGSANGLQLLIKDSAFGDTFVSNGTTANTPGTAPGLNYLTKAGAQTNLTGASACTGNGTNSGCSASGTDTDFLIGSTTSHTGTNITIDYGLPTTANNAYDGATTTIKLTVHAVQQNNNTATGCTNGWQCSTESWS
jgi:hypothetical protein